MLLTLQGGEVQIFAIKKKAIAIIEAIRKWSHLLFKQTLTIITDQRSVVSMFESRCKPSDIYINYTASFVSREFTQYLLKRGIASRKWNICHPARDRQVEKQ